MSPNQISETLKSTVWVRSDSECDAGFRQDEDGYKRRWELIVYHSKCGRFRQEYHVNRDREEFYFQVKSEYDNDDDNMNEYPSFTDLLKDYQEIGEIQQQLEL